MNSNRLSISLMILLSSFWLGQTVNGQSQQKTGDATVLHYVSGNWLILEPIDSRYISCGKDNVIFLEKKQADGVETAFWWYQTGKDCIKRYLAPYEPLKNENVLIKTGKYLISDTIKGMSESVDSLLMGPKAEKIKALLTAAYRYAGQNFYYQPEGRLITTSTRSLWTKYEIRNLSREFVSYQNGGFIMGKTHYPIQEVNNFFSLFFLILPLICALLLMIPTEGERREITKSLAYLLMVASAGSYAVTFRFNDAPIPDIFRAIIAATVFLSINWILKAGLKQIICSRRQFAKTAAKRTKLFDDIMLSYQHKVNLSAASAVALAASLWFVFYSDARFFWVPLVSGAIGIGIAELIIGLGRKKNRLEEYDSNIW